MEQVDVLLTLKRWGLAANHFTFSCLLVPYSEEPFLCLFHFCRPRAVCHVNNDHFYSQTSQRTLGFFKNFFINWFVCLFIFIFTLKCHSKFNYRSTEKKKWQMVRKLKETTRQNYYLSFLTKIRFVTRINLSVITREIMEKRRQTLNKTSGA